MTSDVQRKAQRAALQAYASRCTVPILGHNIETGEKCSVGSAVLYALRGRHYLVTATHVADIYREGRAHLGVPAVRALAEEMDVTSAPSDAHDVTVVVLPDAYVRAIQASGFWCFVDGDEHTDVPTSTESEFLLHGYPSKMNEVTDTTFANGRLSIYTRLYRGTANDVSTAASPQEWDLILAWPSQADGDLVGGMSGCGVWEVQPEGDGLWAASKAIRPVAVDTSMIRGRWFRATSWAYVHAMILDAENRTP